MHWQVFVKSTMTPVSSKTETLIEYGTNLKDVILIQAGFKGRLRVNTSLTNEIITLTSFKERFDFGCVSVYKSCRFRLEIDFGVLFFIWQQNDKIKLKCRIFSEVYCSFHQAW